MTDTPRPTDGRTLLVTGGAGFIGSALVRHLLEATDARVVTVDALTYAGHRETLAPVEAHPRHRFVQLDVTDADGLSALFAEERPVGVAHLAAETHVDRSIDDPEAFVRSNTLGTVRLLEASRRHHASLPPAERDAFRFLMVSTDEVYGSLGDEGAFDERSPYRPRSPYSASKAAADHFARAYFHTFGLPVLVTNCSNNYGPYQFPEKLLPLTLMRALAGQPVPIYGDGSNVRDWLYVEDHVVGLRAVLERGRVGDTYLIGGSSERTNLELVTTLLEVVQELAPGGRDYRELLSFVTDRPGHDHRYAVDASKIRSELGWAPSFELRDGLRATVAWYLDHRDWVRAVTDGRYDFERLGRL